MAQALLARVLPQNRASINPFKSTHYNLLARQSTHWQLAARCTVSKVHAKQIGKNVPVYILVSHMQKIACHDLFGVRNMSVEKYEHISWSCKNWPYSTLLRMTHTARSGRLRAHLSGIPIRRRFFHHPRVGVLQS